MWADYEGESLDYMVHSELPGHHGSKWFNLTDLVSADLWKFEFHFFVYQSCNRVAVCPSFTILLKIILVQIRTNLSLFQR